MPAGVCSGYGKTINPSAIWYPTKMLYGLIGKTVPPVRYEYRCPYCNHINVRYERTGRIVCSKCGRGFG